MAEEWVAQVVSAERDALADLVRAHDPSSPPRA